jgi:hypothetical protein
MLIKKVRTCGTMRGNSGIQHSGLKMGKDMKVDSACFRRKKWPHRKKTPKGIVVTDLAVAPLDLVARVVNAHKGFWAYFESFKSYDLVLIDFC